ncbi:1197_t:CDS:10, partial [Entrophospora sp. SA101]
MSSTELAVGSRCEIQGKIGTIRFVGHTAFSPGKWFGVELDEPLGKNDGSVNGKHYFKCEEKHGVFIRTSQARPLLTPNATQQSQTPTNFAPPNEPATNGRSSRPASIVGLPSKINVLGMSNRSLKGPTSPTSARFGSNSNSNRATSPTLSRKLRGVSDASINSVDLKKLTSVEPDSLDPEEEFSELLGDSLTGEHSESNDVGLEANKATEILKTQEASSISQDPFSLQEASASREQMIPLKDYEELRLKLKILENKRQEDREKLRENEKLKVEAEQFLLIKPKLQVKVTEMQQELRDLKKQFKDVTTEKDVLENKYNEAVESMEMMTLDKEVAEEKVDNLQHEVNMLKEKIEEISVDLTVFKQEGDMVNQGDGSGEARPTLEVIQLEKQNARLREGLAKLREITTHAEQMKQKLAVAEVQIEDLKNRLDDALGAADMFEDLTEKNLIQGEKIEEMRATIDDLEALKELNDELEESHIETEKQLQSEIEQKEILISEYVRRIEAADEANADYENTINQFRELVANLQSDLEQLRQKEESQSSESKNLSSQSLAMMNLNHQLKTTVLKAQGKQIDLELRKLDAAQASENLAFVQPYLPETFFRTENDSIRCLLLLKRIIFKSDLIVKQIDQIHNIPEKLNTVVPEKLISVCELRQKLSWFSDLAKRFVSFINNCPVEIFLRMSQVYHDLIGTEKRIHNILDLLRNEKLKESDYIVEVQRAIAQLEHLTELYLSNTKFGESDEFYAYGNALRMNADTIAVTLGHLKQAVALACKDEVQDSSEAFNEQFFSPLQTLVSQSRSSKVMVKKMLDNLDVLAGKSSVLKSEFLSQFKICYKLSMKLTGFGQEVVKGILAFINEKKDTKEELSLVGINKVIYQITESKLEINEMTVWEGCTKTLQTLCQEINNLSNIANDSDNVVAIAKDEQPWVLRAKQLKAEALVNLDMERKVQQLEQALQEAGIKIDLLERRMETFKRQADIINSLEQEVANSRKHEAVFEEAMESLQQELDNLEKQNRPYHDVAIKIGEEGITPQPHKDGGEDEIHHKKSSTFFENNPLEQQRLTSQVESLRFAVRYLRAENTHLKGKDALNILSWHLNSKKASLEHDKDEEEVIKAISSEARALLKDFRNVSATPRVIDLTKSYEKRNKWQPLNKKPGYQYQTQQSVLYTLQQRSNELKTKLQKLSKVTTNHLPKTPKGANILTTNPPFIGRIRVPMLPNTESLEKAGPKNYFVHNIKLKNPSDFEKIHTIFLTTLFGHVTPIYCVLFDKSGSRVITGSDDRLIRIWCSNSGLLLKSFNGHQREITDMTLDKTGELLASASEDHSIIIWNIKNYSFVHPTTNDWFTYTIRHERLIKSDGVIKNYFGKPKKHKPVNAVKKSMMKASAFNYTGSQFAVSGSDGIIRIFSTIGDQSMFVNNSGSDIRVKNDDFEEDDDLVQIIYNHLNLDDEEIEKLDLMKYLDSYDPTSDFYLKDEHNVTIENNDGSDNSVQMTINDDNQQHSTFSSNGTSTATNNNDVKSSLTSAVNSSSTTTRNLPGISTKRKLELIRLAKLFKARHIADLIDHKKAVTGLEYSHSGTHLLSGSQDGFARIWNYNVINKKWESIELDCREGTGETNITSSRWSLNDLFVIIGSTGGVIKIFDTFNGKLKYEIRTHTNDVYVIDIHPHNWQIIMSAGYDGKICLHNILTGDTLMSWDRSNMSYLDQGMLQFLDGKFNPCGDMFSVTDNFGKCHLIGINNSFQYEKYKDRSISGQQCVTDSLQAEYNAASGSFFDITSSHVIDNNKIDTIFGWNGVAYPHQLSHQEIRRIHNDYSKIENKEDIINKLGVLKDEAQLITDGAYPLSIVHRKLIMHRRKELGLSGDEYEDVVDFMDEALPLEFDDPNNDPDYYESPSDESIINSSDMTEDENAGVDNAVMVDEVVSDYRNPMDIEYTDDDAPIPITRSRSKNIKSQSPQSTNEDNFYNPECYESGSEYEPPARGFRTRTMTRSMIRGNSFGGVSKKNKKKRNIDEFDSDEDGYNIGIKTRNMKRRKPKIISYKESSSDELDDLFMIDDSDLLSTRNSSQYNALGETYAESSKASNGNNHDNNNISHQEVYSLPIFGQSPICEEEKEIGQIASLSNTGYFVFPEDPITIYKSDDCLPYIPKVGDWIFYFPKGHKNMHDKAVMKNDRLLEEFHNAYTSLKFQKRSPYDIKERTIRTDIFNEILYVNNVEFIKSTKTMCAVTCSKVMRDSTFKEFESNLKSDGCIPNEVPNFRKSSSKVTLIYFDYQGHPEFIVPYNKVATGINQKLNVGDPVIISYADGVTYQATVIKMIYEKSWTNNWPIYRVEWSDQNNVTENEEDSEFHPWELTQYYCPEMKYKDGKQILDCIKKDLQEVEDSNSFDTVKEGKAREILNEWK